MDKKSLTVEEILQKIVNYCVYQERCHHEVQQKMATYDLIPEAQDYIISFLLEHNFLNEERFAKSYVRSKFNQKKWGKNKIRLELKRRQIQEKLIAKSLQEIEDELYIKTLQELFEKKYSELRSEKNHWKKKQKIYQYLTAKGYESDLIINVLNAHFSEK